MPEKNVRSKGRLVMLKSKMAEVRLTVTFFSVVFVTSSRIFR